MFYRRRSVFCILWLNSKTLTHTAFLTHAKHANPHQNFDPRYPRQNFMDPRLPLPPTLKFYPHHPRTQAIHATANPHHPRDLADSFRTGRFSENSLWLKSEEAQSRINTTLPRRFINLLWQRSLSYRNQSTDLHNQSMDWFLYHRKIVKSESYLEPLWFKLIFRLTLHILKMEYDKYHIIELCKSDFQ